MALPVAPVSSRSRTSARGSASARRQITTTAERDYALPHGRCKQRIPCARRSPRHSTARRRGAWRAARNFVRLKLTDGAISYISVMPAGMLWCHQETLASSSEPTARAGKRAATGAWRPYAPVPAAVLSAANSRSNFRRSFTAPTSTPNSAGRIAANSRVPMMACCASIIGLSSP